VSHGCVCRLAGQVFELVEPDPIAAASIGQVYKARLRSTGELVAVKVSQRQSILSSIV
jgi:aarF domain-containing kinase